MKKVYLLSNHKPRKDEIEDLNRYFGEIEMIKSFLEIEKFWKYICSLTGMLKFLKYLNGANYEFLNK